jgi:hypothetical protein
MYVVTFLKYVPYKVHGHLMTGYHVKTSRTTIEKELFYYVVAYAEVHVAVSSPKCRSKS